MIVKLDKEQTKIERRKLLGDGVYILMDDTLKKLYKEGTTRLSHVEAFLSAKRFAELLLSLDDVMEGIDDELDDLEDEAEDEVDAVIISMVSTAIILAFGRKHPNIDARAIIARIYTRWIDHPLAFPILQGAARKEKARWLEGKSMQLLDYEIEVIKCDKESEMAVRNLFQYFVGMASSVDSSTIEANLVVLNKYNIDHGHLYDAEINSLYEKLGIKSNTQFNIERVNDIHGNNEVKIGK